MDAQECFATQLIDRDGEFNAPGLDHFLATTNFAECGLSYLIVAIMGPQSGGKSTLMNRLFGTSFEEMDALTGRRQTTKGIWMAKSPTMELSTIVMDMEGSDSRERGEDDTAFEKRSALFALVVADIVIINMWCHDIGRENAANKPLLKTVLQVMMQVFSPHKKTLLFVIRDITKTPLHHLEPILREDLQKIWEQIAKPPAHQNTPLSAFFNVEVTALSSYEAEPEKFNKEVDQLRQRFFDSTSLRGLADDRVDVPASGFSFSAQQTWNKIQHNKELDIPALKELVSNFRCQQIADELFDHLKLDEGWLKLNAAALAGPVSGFGDRFLCILNPYVQGYDKKTMYFHEDVRRKKREQLQSRALDLAHPAYAAISGHLRSTALEEFKRRIEQKLERGEGFNASVCSCTESCMDEFNKGIADADIAEANWDASKIRESFQDDIEKYASALRKANLTEITSRIKNNVTNALCEPIESLFEAGFQGTWNSARTLFIREVDVAISELSNDVECFELDNDEIGRMKENLRDYARNIVEEKAKEEVKKVDLRMKDRFSRVFNLDGNSRPRVWTGKEDIHAITKKARSSSLELLSVLTAMRLGENTDNIQDMLFASLIDGIIAYPIDPLAANSWDEVRPEDTLIKPVECKTLWKKFKDDTEYMIDQAFMAEKAYKWNKTLEVAQAVVAACVTTAIPILIQLI